MNRIETNNRKCIHGDIKQTQSNAKRMQSNENLSTFVNFSRFSIIMKSILLQADTINCNLIKRTQSWKSKICIFFSGCVDKTLNRKTSCGIASSEHKMNESLFTLALKIGYYERRDRLCT